MFLFKLGLTDFITIRVLVKCQDSVVGNQKGNSGGIHTENGGFNNVKVCI